MFPKFYKYVQNQDVYENKLRKIFSRAVEKNQLEYFSRY